MQFFNTFSEIARNRHNFRQWEQQKADEEVRRKKYFEQTPASKEQLKDAAEFGRVIVDTIDLMDSASENKSEAVELATETTTGLVSSLAGGASFVAVLGSSAKATNQHKALLNALEPKVRDVLSDDRNLPADVKYVRNELEHHGLIVKDKDGTKQLKKNIWNGWALIKESKWNNLTSKTRNYFGEHAIEELRKTTNKRKGFLVNLFLVPAAVTFVTQAIGETAGTILQIKASKIARFQARDDLRDPVNFVEYTDEQKAEAQKYVIKRKSKRDVENKSNFGDLKDLIDDYKSYKENSSEFDTLHLADIQDTNPEEAYGRQKVINECIKKMDNKAEDYSENMETAAQVIVGSSVLGGALLGKIAGWLIDKGSKITPSSTKQASNEIFKAAKMNPTFIGAMIGALVVAPFTTDMQKDAARAGRFRAKRELEANPENFLYVDKEKLDAIPEKGKVKKDGFLDVIKFIPEAWKSSREYEKYKKTGLQDKKATLEALKKVPVSDAQIKKAQALQTRLYKSFDVIDDHSQEYSEKMEAVCETSKNLLNFCQTVGMVAVPVIAARYYHRLLKPVSTAFATTLKLIGPFAKKYTRGIGENYIQKMTRRIERSESFKELHFAEKQINEIITGENEAKATEKLMRLKKELEKRYGSEKADEHIMHISSLKKSWESNEAMMDDAKKLDILAKIRVNAETPVTDKEVAGFRKFVAETADNLGSDGSKLDKTKDEDLKKTLGNFYSVASNLPKKELTESLKQIIDFHKENPFKTMIMAREGMTPTAKDILLTKDSMPLWYGLGVAYYSSFIGTSYAIESFLSAKTKEAGRLGTMKALQKLDEENEQAKAKIEAQKK